MAFEVCAETFNGRYRQCVVEKVWKQEPFRTPLNDVRLLVRGKKTFADQQAEIPLLCVARRDRTRVMEVLHQEEEPRETA